VKPWLSQSELNVHPQLAQAKADVDKDSAIVAGSALTASCNKRLVMFFS
jgi:hypothetical protein